MSKYIKLEDAIEQVKTEFYGGGYQEWLEISIDNLINRIANLPTIEVSEDCISRSELIERFKELIVRANSPYLKRGIRWAIGYTQSAPSVVPSREDLHREKEQAYYNGYEDGRKSIEVSEDCISRADLIESFLADSECKREEAKACMCSLDLMLELIENAPSVVPRLDKEDLEDIKEHISESYIEGYMDGQVEGEWIEHKYAEEYNGLMQSNFECSQCHDWLRERTNYCPNCGAKMKV